MQPAANVVFPCRSALNQNRRQLRTMRRSASRIFCSCACKLASEEPKNRPSDATSSHDARQAAASAGLLRPLNGDAQFGNLDASPGNRPPNRIASTGPATPLAR